MKIVRPVQVNDDNLNSTNIPETDYAVWNSGTSYVVGDRVIVVATHKIYEALTSSSGSYPPNSLTGTTPAWLEVGATNAWKMFDSKYSSQTSGTGSIIISLSPGGINTIGLLGLDANEVTIVMMDGATEVYNKTISLIIDEFGDWYEYFFNPFETKADVALTDIPYYINGEITITISSGISSPVKCGLCIVGFYTKLGETLWGSQAGIIDYSRKEIDIFGDFNILQRGYSKKLSADIFVENSRVGYITNLLAQYRTTPALWIGHEDYESTIIYGYYKDFSTVLQSPAGSSCAIEIEGLT